MPTYADWKAPQADRNLVIWPDPAQILALARKNHLALKRTDFPIHNSSLAELRKSLRAFVGVEEDQLVFVAGHQAELWHPGVWAKNILIDAAAQTVDPSRRKSKAIHLSVDTDQPKHLELKWPGDGRAIRHPITDDPELKSKSWASHLASPTPAHLQTIESDLNRGKNSFDFEPMLGEVLHSMRMSALDGVEGVELPSALVGACHELDWSLGLDYTIMTLSPLLEAEHWLVFVRHILDDAHRFANEYNRALADYRNEQRIESATRPMPDLSISTESIELPFWLDELSTGKRHRANVRIERGRIFLNGLEVKPESANSFSPLRTCLIQNKLRIAPRALMLTVFLRLLLADVFVHGIGGGRYDQIADRLIQSYFKIDPPGFAVTTATLYWPGALMRERANLADVISEGHRLHHASLGVEKSRRVEAISAAPRHSTRRAELFYSLHRDLRSAAATNPEVVRWQSTLESTRQRAIEDEIVFDRELFYALQPRERLEALIANYRAAFSG